MPYKFIKTPDPSNLDNDHAEVTYEIKNHDLTCDFMVQEFKNFMMACGYAEESLDKHLVDLP